MKNDIHPKYGVMKATCSCGNVIETRSTMAKEIHIDVCSACHPFYTGKQKVVDSGGRIDKFNKRFKRAAGQASTSSTSKKFDLSRVKLGFFVLETLFSSSIICEF